MDVQLDWAILATEFAAPADIPGYVEAVEGEQA